MLIKKLISSKTLISMVFVLIFLLSTNINADTCGPDFKKGIEQYRLQNYDEAIRIFDPISKSRNMTDECSSNALVYIGICKFLSGNTNQAQADFIEAIKLFPNIKLPEEGLPDDLVKLFGDTQKRLLCDVELYVQTPYELAMNVDNQIKLIYRLKNVLVGEIKAKASKFSEFDMEYDLISGKTNRFYIQIDRLRDYHAYDSLVLSFYPHEDFPETRKFEELDDGSFIIKSGSQKIAPMEDHYQGPILTSIEIRNDGPVVVIPILEVTQRFNKLLRDLHYNSIRKRLNTTIKKVSVAGFAVSAAWSIIMHTKLGSAYDDYLLQVHPSDVQDSYRNYVGKVHKRNRLAVIAGFFALARVVAERTEPSDEQKILNRYNNRRRSQKLSLLIEPEIIGLKYTIPL
jgi:hypothetical protein